jgi:hypothetical protein
MNAIVDSILAQQRETGAWELSADTVRQLLGIDHADFYRRIYEEAMRGNRMVDLSMTTARFRQENVGELVTLLELFEGTNADTAREYVELAGYPEPELAAANVYDLLEHYFSRHVLERETVLAAVCISLFEIAVEVGAVRRPEEEWAEKERRGNGERRGAGEQARGRSAAPHRRAREVMELEPDDGALSTSYLKAQYKALMKRYHPDVNPRGLRACQRINEAYSLLLASAADSP